MIRVLHIFIFTLLLSTPAFAENTADQKLLQMMGAFESSRYATGSENNYQIINACFYTVYQEWEQGYIEVLKKTPLDASKISTLNIYSAFTAGIHRDMHYLKANYPNLFSNIKHYIQSHRADKTWPAGPQIMAIEEIFAPLLIKNLEECYVSEINTVLANTVAAHDDVAGIRALDDIVSATFVRSEPGINLVIKVNQDVQSNIPGVDTSIGQDDFITEIPKKN